MRWFVAACALSVVACGTQPPAPVSASVFTPAHRTFGDAARDFFGVRPKPSQPIPFPHKAHIAKKAVCTDCHESVEKGPIAGIPSVKTCMICHSQIATDKPLIKEVTAYSEKGVEIPWQRVYGFTHAAHVRFNHAPHVRANVDCATCHGDVANQTVAERAVDHNMGFCVNCHKQKNASNDCLTCHRHGRWGVNAHGSARFHQAHRDYGHERDARKLRQSRAPADSLRPR